MTTICESCDLKECCWDYPNEADGCTCFSNSKMNHYDFPILNWFKKIFKGKEHDAS